MAVRRFSNGEVEFVGRVLRTRERNGYHDSDWYALVWDDELGKPREVEYGTTRGANALGFAQVDADDATLAKLTDYLVRVFTDEMKAAAREAATTVERGKAVKLGRTVRTKKNGVFEKNATGTVFWVGDDRYRRGAKRAGVRFGDGRKHFFATDDLLVRVADDGELFDLAEIRELAESRAAYQVNRIRDRRVARETLDRLAAERKAA